MKKTELTIELVDATPDQIAQAIKIITDFGDNLVSFNVSSGPSKVTMRGSGANGRFLYGDPEDTQLKGDPALEPEEEVQQVDILPKTQDLESPVADVKRVADRIDARNLKKYL